MIIEVIGPYNTIYDTVHYFNDVISLWILNNCECVSYSKLLNDYFEMRFQFTTVITYTMNQPRMIL